MSAPTFTVYQHPRFLKIIESVYNLRRVAPFPVRDDNKLLSFFMSRNPLKQNHIFSLPFQFYYSPHFQTDSMESSFFRELENFSSQSGRNVIASSLRPYEYPRQVVTANNPILEFDGTYNDTKRRFSRNLRSNLKRNTNKAEREKIDISLSDNLRDLARFYTDVLAEQYIHQHQMIFQPLELFRKLLVSDLAKLFIARREKSIVGGIITIRDGDVLHYNWGASLPCHNIALGTLIIDFSIRYAIKQGCRFYDFGSTPLSDDNLLNFKLRWGSDNYPVYTYYTLKAPDRIDLHSSYRTARVIYSKLPKSLIIKLIPHIVPWLV